MTNDLRSSEPQYLDGLTPHQLVDEIKQINQQFNVEIPGERRHWPRSIKERVLALGRLGIPLKKISRLAEIPPTTVFLWCRALPQRRRRGQKRLSSNDPGFIELTPTNLTVGLNRTGSDPDTPSASETLTFVLPGGFEVRGITSPVTIAQLYRAVNA